MEKYYSPKEIESHWYQVWENDNTFTPQGNGKPFCIMLPPPNVTGTLHMGHAFQNTIMDCLIRYHRMQGYHTLWQPGTDHAGIATQMVVERQLAAQNIERKTIGRDEFLKKVWAWKEQSGNQITQQLRRLGASLDWSRECFTMDENLSASVNKAFIKLYDKGLIYKGKRLVNWDPALKTAVSDLEVLSTEENGHLWHICYPLDNTEDELIVATTRPETMLGDTAVAVNPNDKRYQHLIGKIINLPLTERKIPIIADEYVDPAFGSGCVKITPAHDFNDYEIGKRHQLPTLNIMEPDASLNNEVPLPYQGLDRYSARKKIVADLDKLGLLKKIEPHSLVVPRGDRSNSVIEPYLTDQWFLQTQTLADKAKQAVKNGKIRFVPDAWNKTYFEWMDNIQDWCISRQLWWGHRIPAWYDKQGNCYVAHTESDARQKYQLHNDLDLTQDEDVLDTWFSSSLWPFSTLSWPQQTTELEKFYPGNVLVTGFDIIFFWVARMIMMGIEFMNDVPFYTVYIHGLVRDSDGEKMSKSKGNVLDPIDLIDGISLENLLKKRLANLMQEQFAKKIKTKTKQQFPDGIATYGADALRFTFMAMASGNRNIRFDIKRIEGYRNFCNKLWNATRLTLSLCNTENTPDNNQRNTPILDIDQWIKQRIINLSDDLKKDIVNYRFDLLANKLYEFIWHDYCDWYLEFSKIIQNGDYSDELQAANRASLVSTLETILRFLHPITPFITEELWQQIKLLTQLKVNTIQYRPYPEEQQIKLDQNAIEGIIWMKELITVIRSVRSEMNISPAKQIPLLVQNWKQQEKIFFIRYQTIITRLAKLDNIKWLAENDTAPKAMTAIVGNMRLLIPLDGLVDIEAETNRLKKEIDKLNKNLDNIESKLQNENFIKRAPESIVNQHRTQKEALQATLQQLKEQLTQMCDNLIT